MRTSPSPSSTHGSHSPARRSQASSSFAPPPDAQTFRDLLLFEERLKSNALALKRRKRGYQCFLLQLLGLISFLLAEVLLSLQILSIPYSLLLAYVLPDLYSPEALVKTGRSKPVLHPAFATGLLTVGITTLVLFFASGLYGEKIGYANRYVPHANKTLRTLNMSLNVRRPPLLSRLPVLKHIPSLFGRPSPSTAYTSATFSPPVSPVRSRRGQSPSPPTSPLALSPGSLTDPHDPVTRALPTPPSPPRPTGIPLTPIPPSQNPRGELIFSARVPGSFTASYSRHRGLFERRRKELIRKERGKTWTGWAWNGLTRVFGGKEDEDVSLGEKLRTPGGTPVSTPRSGTPAPGPRPSSPGVVGPLKELGDGSIGRSGSGRGRGRVRPSVGRRESGIIMDEKLGRRERSVDRWDGVGAGVGRGRGRGVET